MRLLRLPGTAAVLVCVLLGARVASADPTPADKTAATSENQKATAASNAKRFRVAAELYESSYKHVPDAKTLFNAATAWQKNGDAAKAANTYARYLKEPADKTPQRDKAKKELDALASKLGQLGIKAEGATGVTVDGETIDLPPPAVVYVNVGPHEVEARFGEKKVTQSPVSPAGALTGVVLMLPPEPAKAPVAAVVAPAPAPAKPVVEARAKPLPPLVVYIGAGATVLAGGLTVISALDTSSQKTAFDAEPSQDNLDSGKSKQLRTNVLLVVTGALAVTTGVAAIFLVEWKGRSTEPSVKAGAGPGSVVIRGTF